MGKYKAIGPTGHVACPCTDMPNKTPCLENHESLTFLAIFWGKMWGFDSTREYFREAPAGENNWLSIEIEGVYVQRQQGPAGREFILGCD